MRAIRCPGCGWQPPHPINADILIGPGEHPRIVVVDERVPVAQLERNVEKIHAWSLSGWAGLEHTCVTDLPTLEQAGAYDTRQWPRRRRLKVAALIVFLLAATGFAVWALTAWPAAILIAVAALLVATGSSFHEELTGEPLEVAVWKSDRRGRYRTRW